MARTEFLESLGVPAPPPSPPPPPVEPQEQETERPEDVGLRDLAEKTGRQVQFLLQHGTGWSEVEWVRRREVACRNIDRLWEELQARGLTFNDLGWNVTPCGLWHRLDEEPVQPGAAPVPAGLLHHVGGKNP